MLADETWESKDRATMLGSDQVLCLAFVFLIYDPKEAKKHYFLAGGLPGSTIEHLQYFGENITDIKARYGGAVLSVEYDDPRMTNKVITTYWGYGARGFQFVDKCDYANTEHIKLIPMCRD